MSYAVVKALHLISVISWFAGLFYIFRLFVYHVQNWQEPHTRQVLSTMERKLLTYIMRPASVGALVFGLTMLYLNPGLLSTGWIWVKFAFVLLLVVYHELAVWTFKQMQSGRMVFSERSCRLINEVPTLSLIAISFLVFLKPF